jgi:hypothetical protein
MESAAAAAAQLLLCQAWWFCQVPPAVLLPLPMLPPLWPQLLTASAPAAPLKPLTAVEHALAQQEVSHPLADDDVYLLRQLNGLNGALDHLNNMVKLQHKQVEVES